MAIYCTIWSPLSTSCMRHARLFPLTGGVLNVCWSDFIFLSRESYTLSKQRGGISRFLPREYVDCADHQLRVTRTIWAGYLLVCSCHALSQCCNNTRTAIWVSMCCSLGGVLSLGLQRLTVTTVDVCPAHPTVCVCLEAGQSVVLSSCGCFD